MRVAEALAPIQEGETSASGQQGESVMTSRERVLRVLNHQQPDRVPIDFGATRQSGIAASAYHKLKTFLGISTPTRLVDVIQMLGDIEQPVMDRFGVD